MSKCLTSLRKKERKRKTGSWVPPKAVGRGQYSRQRAQFFPIRTDLGWWTTFLFFSLNLPKFFQTNWFKAAFSHWVPSVSVVQLTVQMTKLNGLWRTHRKRICNRIKNFARPLTTNKLFERIQVLNEWKLHRLIHL